MTSPRAGTTRARSGDRDVAAHRWLTTDVVLFDGLIATPTGTSVADPLHILVGDESLRNQLVRRPPGELRERTDEIVLHEIEQLYGQLKLTTRAHRGGVPSSG